MSYFKKLAATIVGVVLVSLSALGTAKATEPAQDEELAYAIGVQTYIYGFPMMDLYRTLWETSFDPDRDHDRTLNELYFFRRLVTHEDTWVVSPNEDTIYHRSLHKFDPPHGHAADFRASR